MRTFKLKWVVLLVSFVGLVNVYAQTITDVDGNYYTTITIGTQTWIKEDLKVTHYLNGDLIGTLTDTAYICYEKSPKYQWAYDGNEARAKEYGRLYTWNVVMDDRKVCPTGWHVPNIQEWMVLKRNLGIDTISFLQREINGGSVIKYIADIFNNAGFTLSSNEFRKCGGIYIKSPLGGWWSYSADDMHRAVLDLLPNKDLGIFFKSVVEDKYALPVRCLMD